MDFQLQTDFRDEDYFRNDDPRESVPPLPSNLHSMSIEKLRDLGTQMRVYVEPGKSKEDLVKKIKEKHTKSLVGATKEYEKIERFKIPGKNLRNFATKRLQRDLKELFSTQLSTVTCRPLKNDLFTWHVNLRAPRTSRYYGAIFHLVFKFSVEYPYAPPKVEIKTNLHHSHVFGSSLCIDILDTHHSEQAYFGWSTSYSVLSLCLQLQAFLLEEEKDQTPYIASDVFSSLEYRCPDCGHDPENGKPYPWEAYWEKKMVQKHEIIMNMEKYKDVDIQKRYYEGVDFDQYKLDIFEENPQQKKEESIDLMDVDRKKPDEIQEEEKVSKQNFFFLDEIVVNIFSFFERWEIIVLSRVCQQWKGIAFHPYIWQSKETLCFHSKRSFQEDVIGVGFNITRSREGKILSVETPLCLLSKTSFYEEKIRRGVWNEPIQFWIPIFIEGNHFRKALPFFKKSVEEIYNEDYRPILAIDLICKFLNSMIVTIMNGSTHASINALQGYCYFHRMLIYFMLKDQSLLGTINGKLEKFVENEKNRHKSQVPSLGELLPLISISKYSFNQIKNVLIDEVFQRNSLWVKFKHQYIYGKVIFQKRKFSKEDIRKAFEVEKISLKLILFHAIFLTKICGVNEKSSLENIARDYDGRYGYASSSMKNILQKEVFNIQKISGFFDFFKHVGINPGDLSTYLTKAMISGNTRGYMIKGKRKPAKSFLETDDDPNQKNDDDGGGEKI